MKKKHKVRLPIVLLLSSVLASGLAPTSASAMEAYRAMSYGDSGDDVLEMQTLLTSIGYSLGSLDGYFGYWTEAAVIAFQENTGIYVDGVAGPWTIAVLNSLTNGGFIEQNPVQEPVVEEQPTEAVEPEIEEPEEPAVPEEPVKPEEPEEPAQTSTELAFDRSLEWGDNGDDVAMLQTALTSLGYSLGLIDGWFGNMTENAVLRFQEDAGIYVDGVAGPWTISVLNAALAGYIVVSPTSSGTSANSQPEQSVSYEFSTAKSILDQIGWDLKTAYYWVVNHNYSEVTYYFTESTRWYADYFFTNGCGNCYCFSSAFYELAKTLGYDAHVVTGYVPYVNGGYGTHSWVEIDLDGSTWVCDPQFENDEDKNGYFIYYRQSGTWMYTDYSRVN